VSKRTLPIVTRRELLRWAGAATATTLPATLPTLVGCSSSPAPHSSVPLSAPSYFTTEDVAILNALADAVLPPDDVVGGSKLGVVSYIETLLTAFDSDPPKIYAGGPFSGRAPLAMSNGHPSSTFPENEFATFLPLDRFQTADWKLRIYGSSGVPGGGPNDSITGPVIGLREAVATAIKDAKAALPPKVSVEDLTQDEKTTMLRALDKTTQSTLIELVIEGAFTAPEYGGNTKQAGWRMMYFEGDRQPVGFSWFDVTTGTYSEDPLRPVSTPNPGADPMPLDAMTEQLVGTVVTLLGGKVFP
jgi:Gluconate 2-dehydrogenase subunit 3